MAKPKSEYPPALLKLADEFHALNLQGDKSLWAQADKLREIYTALEKDVIDSTWRTVADLLGYKYSKSYLSKLQATGEAFPDPLRKDALAKGATFYDCYQCHRLNQQCQRRKIDQTIPNILAVYFQAKRDKASNEDAYNLALDKLIPESERTEPETIPTELFTGLLPKLAAFHPTGWETKLDQVAKATDRTTQSMARKEFEGATLAILYDVDTPILVGHGAFKSEHRRDCALMSLVLFALKTMRGDTLTTLGYLCSRVRERDMPEMGGKPLVDAVLRSRMRELAELASTEAVAKMMPLAPEPAPDPAPTPVPKARKRRAPSIPPAIV